ncbi:MAG: sugar transferase [Syntrophales bacterium]|nr:sugar transferase [Syntrophales bacterium]
MKRIVDLVCAGMGLTILSPVLIIIAFLIKKEDDGPIFYRGERVGLNGRIFRIFKFRTMVVHAERIGGASTANEDPRITRIGRFLRKYKFDELPQFINVLIGDMSMVGPRPEVKYYTDMYSEEEKAILSIRPGITDWASIWNVDEGAVLAGAKDPERAYEELIRPKKLKLQLKYVKERSFRIDMKIIFLTLLAVINPGSKALKEIRTQ